LDNNGTNRVRSPPKAVAGFNGFNGFNGFSGGGS
jgi:hypothetical protein